MSFTKTLKMYALTGIVKAVKAETHKITVQDAYIHGRKEPVERDYAFKDPAAFSGVKEGDSIYATLLTDNAGVWLLDEATFKHSRARRSA